MYYVFDQYCFPHDKNDLEVKIKVSSEVKNIILYFGDPHNYVKNSDDKWVWQEKNVNMELENETKDIKYFSSIINEEKSRFRYYFKIELNNNESFFYGQCGNFFDNKGDDFDIYSTFFFPYIHDHEFFKGPKWVEEQIWLQIFVDRFSNGDKSNDPETTLEWGDKNLSGQTFFGGDLRGIINKLDYIKDLGYTGIYLTPIFLANSSHKYNTLDYLTIDPAFGTKEDLKELVEKSHKLGIKVMLDAVLNHSSIEHKFFQDIISNKDKSEYLNYYHIRNMDPFDYETFSNVLGMPKWNTQNKDVQDYFLYVLNYYIESFGIDGWRFDVANELDHTFVRMINRSIKSKYPEFYLMAEMWHDPSDWISYDQFDANMEYEISSIFVKYLNKTISAETAVNRLSEIQYRTPTNQLDCQFHMIDSHDTMRVFNMVGKNETKALMALLILAVQKGSVCFYYGDEYLMEGETDPYCRACLPIEPSKEDEKIREKFKNILSFRKNNIELIKNNKPRFLSDNNKLLICFGDRCFEIDNQKYKIYCNGQETII